MRTTVNPIFPLLISLLLSVAAEGCMPGADPSSLIGLGGNGSPTSSGNPAGSGSAPEEILAPTFAPSPGRYVALTEVTITAANTGATIRYTSDGSDPTSGSPSYDPAKKPRMFSDSIWKAIAIKDGRSSPIASAAYAIDPYYPDFSLSLAVGLRWNFHYKYSHFVAYSQAGTSTSTPPLAPSRNPSTSLPSPFRRLWTSRLP